MFFSSPGRSFSGLVHFEGLLQVFFVLHFLLCTSKHFPPFSKSYICFFFLYLVHFKMNGGIRISPDMCSLNIHLSFIFICELNSMQQSAPGEFFCYSAATKEKTKTLTRYGKMYEYSKKKFPPLLEKKSTGGRRRGHGITNKS